MMCFYGSVSRADDRRAVNDRPSNATGGAPSFRPRSTVGALERDESMLWKRRARFHEQLQKRGEMRHVADGQDVSRLGAQYVSNNLRRVVGPEPAHHDELREGVARAQKRF